MGYKYNISNHTQVSFQINYHPPPKSFTRLILRLVAEKMWGTNQKNFKFWVQPTKNNTTSNTPKVRKIWKPECSNTHSFLRNQSKSKHTEMINLTGLILIINSKTHKEFQHYLQFVHKAIPIKSWRSIWFSWQTWSDLEA